MKIEFCDCGSTVDMYICKTGMFKDGHTCSFKTCILRKAARFVSTSNNLATTYFEE